MAKKFIIVKDCPNSEIILNNIEKINEFINKFKQYYSRFDKRLLTTQKKVNVNLQNGIINISIDFNKKHYGQCYGFSRELIYTY